MIFFKRLTYKNFLSSGMMPIVLELNDIETTLVLGENGAGKSTMLDALDYVLFKKAFRNINLADMINTINNGDLLVTVEFSIGTDEYEVRRGMKPDIFEIYKNGEKRKNEAASKDPQKYLEEDILQVNYDSFNQVVLLGNAKYTPFMKLTTPERRKFIEHILDISVFSYMNDELKAKQKNLKIHVDSIMKAIESAEDKVKLVNSFIAKLEAEQSKAVVDTQAQIDEQTAIIEEIEPFISGLQATVQAKTAELSSQTEALNEASEAKLDELEAAYQANIAELKAGEVDASVWNNKLTGFAPLRHGILNNLKSAQESLAFYTDNESCKTCKQTIHSDFRDTIVEEKKAAIAKFEEGLVKLDLECDKLRTKVAAAKEKNVSIKEQCTQAYNAYQATSRKIMAETAALIKEVTGTLGKEIKELTADLNEKQTTVKAARQYIVRMEAIKKAAGVSANIEEQFAKRDEYMAEVARQTALKEEAIETRHYYDVAAVLLKDTGIKAAIVKQYLNVINQLTNKYLAELNFFCLFALDENFNATFKSRHRDTFKYNSFSEGQKMRIDLALLFAWRDLARMKNTCATNLLILDEVTDSSLDAPGADLFIEMLNNLEDATNVFVISHKKDAALDKFKKVIRFDLQKNFSTYSIAA